MYYKKALDTVLFVYDGKYYIGKGDRVFSVNETGARVYELCNGNFFLNDITEKIADKFNICQEIISDEIEAYIKNLIELKIINEK